MDILINAPNIILHVDKYLSAIIAQYDELSYVVMFAVIFSETGFVFAPFLPGDSLLFAAGALSAIESFNLLILLVVFWLAAFLGDTVNYWIGHFFGQKLIDHPKVPVNQEHVNKAQAFYEKYGGKAIFLARFIPIIRTAAPFVAGIGKMDYKKFVYYNATGGLVWVSLFTLLGYFFGNIKHVKENFSIVIIAIIALSLLPVVIELIKARREKPAKPEV